MHNAEVCSASGYIPVFKSVHFLAIRND